MCFLFINDFPHKVFYVYFQNSISREEWIQLIDVFFANVFETAAIYFTQS